MRSIEWCHFCPSRRSIIIPTPRLCPFSRLRRSDLDQDLPKTLHGSRWIRAPILVMICELLLIYAESFITTAVILRQGSKIRQNIRINVNRCCRDVKRVLTPSEWIHKFHRVYMLFLPWECRYWNIYKCSGGGIKWPRAVFISLS